uniref:Uncharacterized protein n=1 Tax=Caenorhabditis japonica TaxID=281687 RepID=A0A8R1IX63_CAEJA
MHNEHSSYYSCRRKKGKCKMYVCVKKDWALPAGRTKAVSGCVCVLMMMMMMICVGDETKRDDDADAVAHGIIELSTPKGRRMKKNGKKEEEEDVEQILETHKTRGGRDVRKDTTINSAYSSSFFFFRSFHCHPSRPHFGVALVGHQLLKAF